MTSLAEVRLWGRTIGAVALDNEQDVASFEYDAAFAQSGIQVAPIAMPLSGRVYRFPSFLAQLFVACPACSRTRCPINSAMR